MTKTVHHHPSPYTATHRTAVLNVSPFHFVPTDALLLSHILMYFKKQWTNCSSQLLILSNVAESSIKSNYNLISSHIIPYILHLSLYPVSIISSSYCHTEGLTHIYHVYYFILSPSNYSIYPCPLNDCYPFMAVRRLLFNSDQVMARLVGGCQSPWPQLSQLVISKM